MNELTQKLPLELPLKEAVRLYGNRLLVFVIVVLMGLGLLGVLLFMLKADIVVYLPVCLLVIMAIFYVETHKRRASRRGFGVTYGTVPWGTG